MDERPYSPFESESDDNARRRDDDDTDFERAPDTDDSESLFGHSAGPLNYGDSDNVEEPPLPDLPPVDPERNAHAYPSEEYEEGSTWRQDLASSRGDTPASPYETEYHVAGAQEGVGDDEARMEANLELERTGDAGEADYLTAPSAAGGTLGEGTEYVESSFDQESDYSIERNERRVDEGVYGAAPPPAYGRVEMNEESREPEGLLEPHEPPLALPHEPLGDAHLRRDGETLLMLGGFMAILSIPVLIGTAFAVREHAMIVNAIAGGVLLLTGAGFLFRGWWTLRKAP